MSLKNIINRVNSVNKHKLLKIKHWSLKKIQTILNFLITEGFIYGYKVVNGYVKVFIKKSLNTYKILRQKTNKYLTNFQLVSLIKKNPFTTFVVSTGIGLVSNTEICKKKIGGKLLFIINSKNAHV